ncbi:hypothetical protein [Pseudomonas savastanoi]|uniref:hypothetical protein n=1 Tax=Pseudomonas savastanoi TaxID=29438 RepID=UPI000EFE16A6|nr:hypothetical protein [Pseudomonas savastanoi]RML92460.1 hypothetical protein ALQ87_02057 [Pseudomonas savastanoi pv. glycinea]
MGVTVILVVLQILTMVAWTETNIKKTEEGKRVLETLSAGGLFFLRWRANADHKKELRFLGWLSGWIAVLSIGIFQIVPNEAKPMISSYCIVFLALWLAIRIGSDVKGQVSEILAMGALFFCAPYLMLLADWTHALPFSLLETFVAPIPAFASMGLSGFKLAFTLSMLGGCVTLVMLVLGLLCFSIIPLFILFVMVMMSKACRNLLRWEISRARNYVALYVVVVGPILLTLHSYKVI